MMIDASKTAYQLFYSITHIYPHSKLRMCRFLILIACTRIDFELNNAPPPPLGNFADISYLEENFKPHLLRDVCTLCSGALVSDSLIHMLL